MLICQNFNFGNKSVLLSSAEWVSLLNYKLRISASKPSLWCSFTLVNSAPRSGFSLICSLLSIFIITFWLKDVILSKLHSDIYLGQALDLLVSVSWTCYHAYTSDLSTLCSSRGLTGLRHGKSYLEVGFTLRCFQRLSRPDIATQLCSWRNNWCTRGQSIPVLSY